MNPRRLASDGNRGAAARVGRSVPRSRGVIVGCLAVATVSAQTTPPVETLPTQTVVGVKSPLTVPVKRAYEATAKLRSDSGDRVELVIRLKDRAAASAPALAVRLDAGESSVPLPLDRGRSFVMPVGGEPPPDDARFVVNRKPGEVSVQVDIRPRPFTSGATAAELRASIAAGREAMRGLLPWYARLLAPTVRGLKICTQSGGRIGWVDGLGQATPVAVSEADDVFDRPSRCASFLSSSDTTPDADRLEFPADATFDYVGSMF